MSLVFAVHGPFELLSFLVLVFMCASRNLNDWYFPISLHLHGNACSLVLLAYLELVIELYVAQFASSFGEISLVHL